MLDELLEGKALEQWHEEAFELNIFKSKGMDKPGMRYKGSQHGLLGGYIELIDIIMKEDMVPAEVLHDTLMYVAEKNGKVAHGKHESK